jgi:hypothetical protein
MQVQSDDSTPSKSIIITTEDKLTAIVNIPYKRQLEANLPVKWSVGLLPKGLSLEDGCIIGRPVELGEVVNIEVTATMGSLLATKVIQFTVVDGIWVNLPEVTITNFHPNARAEYTIEVHNGESIELERKIVTTDDTDVPDSNGFISVTIPLKQTLYSSEIKVVSSIQESLYVSRYDLMENSVTINGFLPLTTREIAISYEAIAWFGVWLEGDSPLISLTTIEPNHFSLKPHETKKVLIAIVMPEDYVPKEKLYEFDVLVGKSAPTLVVGMSTILQHKAPWHIHMR